MRNPGGQATWVFSDGKRVEKDSFTCQHCNVVVFLEVKQSAADAGGFCRMCMKPTCARCTDLGSCTPFEKKLEAIERQNRLMKALR